jgi:uncharacterized protein YccT (UPF0319 family)
MKSTSIWLVFCFVLFAAGAFANEKVVSTLNRVDLIAVDKQNEKNHNYGTDYYALNHNDFPVQVTIQITNSVNTQDGLITGPVVINPNEKTHLGWLLQNNDSLEAKWNVQWQVSKP